MKIRRVIYGLSWFIVFSMTGFANEVPTDYTFDEAILSESEVTLDLSSLSLEPVELVGTALWAWARKATFRDNYLYAPYPFGLIIMDLTNPSSPIELGRVFTQVKGSSLCLSGDFAYMVGKNYLLEIIDISDPTNPFVVGTVDSLGSGGTVEVQNGYAYVTSYKDGVRIIDVSDPINPFLASSYTDSINTYSLVLSGDLAYVSKADTSASLIVLDISDPLLPIRVGAVAVPGRLYAMELHGTHLIGVPSSLGFSIFDLTDPLKPILLSESPDDSYADRGTLLGDYVYTVHRSHGLHVIDVSDRSNPEMVPFESGSEFLNSDEITASNGVAFISRSDYAALVVDLSDPVNPIFTSDFRNTGHLFTVALDGDLAYIGTSLGGMQVLDISNPSEPLVIGEYIEPEPPYGYYRIDDIALYGNYAFATTTQGTQVLDISNPSTPTLVSTIDDVGRIEFSGHYALIATRAAGVKIIDISDITAPKQVSFIITAGDEVDVTIQGHIAYTANSRNGVSIIDISDKSNPGLISTIDLPGDSKRIWALEDILLVASHGVGLNVVDISDRQNPVLLRTITEVTYIKDMEVHGQLAAITSNELGLYLFDLTDPANPVLAGHFETPDQTYDVSISSKNLVLVDIHGVLILQSPLTACCGTYTEGFTGNADFSSDGVRNLGDITRLIDHLYISKTALKCRENGNVDGDESGSVNLGDLAVLIDHIYLRNFQTATCQ